MVDPQDDWSWFETASADIEGPVSGDLPELARIAARVFQSDDGDHLLSFMKAITSGRTLGPNATDNQLRHLEGQRFFVSKLNALIRRGRSANS